MSYGIEIKNSDSHIIIDDKYPNLLVTHSGIVSAGSSYPPPNTNLSNGDMVMVQPRGKTSGTWRSYIRLPTAQEGEDAPAIDWNNDITFPSSGIEVPSSWNYKILKPFGLTKSTTGYGLEIYDETGEEVMFSSEIDNNMEIVAVGNVNPYNQDPVPSEALDSTADLQATYYIPYGEDINDYFVMINKMLWVSWEITVGHGIGTIVDGVEFFARYHYSGTKKIELWSDTAITYIIGKYIS